MQKPKKSTKDVSRKILVGVLITLLVVIFSLVTVLAVELVKRARDNKAESSNAYDIEESGESNAESGDRSGNSAGNAGEQPGENTSEPSDEQSGEQSGENSGENSGDNSGENSGENTSEPSDEQSGEQSGEPSGENSSENSGDNSGKENDPSETSAGEKIEGPFKVTEREMTSDDIHRGILQLVNKQNEYLFLDGWLTDIENYDTYGFILSEYGMQMADVAAPYYCDFLNGFYEETGIYNIYMMNGYRTPEDAEYLFWRSAEENGLEHAEKYVMRAGFSEHHTGLASDLGLIEGGPYFEVISEEYQWVYDHAADYGFVLRYAEEKEAITEIGAETWHFRYVGIPCARIMYDNNYCLEEFLEMIRDYDELNPLTVTCTGTDGVDGDYAIYYQEGLVINVPDGLDYEISGNNMDGFVIIAKLPESD